VTHAFVEIERTGDLESGKERRGASANTSDESSPVRFCTTCLKRLSEPGVRYLCEECFQAWRLHEAEKVGFSGTGRHNTSRPCHRYR